jgi:hypothetical protein
MTAATRGSCASTRAPATIFPWWSLTVRLRSTGTGNTHTGIGQATSLAAGPDVHGDRLAAIQGI